MTCAELVERHGGCKVGHTNGNERIEDVLGGIKDTFESPGEVRDAVVSTVGAAAVGRRQYSDREPPEESDERPIESF